MKLRTGGKRSRQAPARRVLRIEQLERRCVLSGPAELVLDIQPGDAGSKPSDIAAVGDVVYFAADDGVSGRELWQSDGTAPGTHLAFDVVPGANGSNPKFLTTLGGSTYFFTVAYGAHALWRLDADGPSQLAQVRAVLAPIVVGNRFYFAAINDATNGGELWVSDGSADGTHRVSNLYSDQYGLRASMPLRMAAVGDVLYYRHNDGVHGFELWRTDGTESGTFLVKDIDLRPRNDSTGVGSSSPTWLVNVGETLYFTARDATGLSIWKTDGTEEGTVALDRETPNGSYQIPTSLATANGKLFFSALQGGEFLNPGSDLWSSDGSTEGTTRLVYLGLGSPTEMIDLSGILYFTTELTSQRILSRSDGTPDGTSIVEQIGISSFLNSPVLTNVRGVMYFAGEDAPNGIELWSSDGSAAGTSLIQDINPYTVILPSYEPVGSVPAEFVAAGDRLFFRANDGVHGAELWSMPLPAQPTSLVEADGADFLSWQRNLGTSVIAGFADDWDQSGTVDAGDQAVWQLQFGSDVVSDEVGSLSTNPAEAPFAENESTPAIAANVILAPDLLLPASLRAAFARPPRDSLVPAASNARDAALVVRATPRAASALDLTSAADHEISHTSEVEFSTALIDAALAEQL